MMVDPKIIKSGAKNILTVITILILIFLVYVSIHQKSSPLLSGYLEDALQRAVRTTEKSGGYTGILQYDTVRIINSSEGIFPLWYVEEESVSKSEEKLHIPSTKFIEEEIRNDILSAHIDDKVKEVSGKSISLDALQVTLTKNAVVASVNGINVSVPSSLSRYVQLSAQSVEEYSKKGQIPLIGPYVITMYTDENAPALKVIHILDGENKFSFGIDIGVPSASAFPYLKPSSPLKFEKSLQSLEVISSKYYETGNSLQEKPRNNFSGSLYYGSAFKGVPTDVRFDEKNPTKLLYGKNIEFIAEGVTIGLVNFTLFGTTRNEGKIRNAEITSVTLENAELYYVYGDKIIMIADIAEPIVVSSVGTLSDETAVLFSGTDMLISEGQGRMQFVYTDGKSISSLESKTQSLGFKHANGNFEISLDNEEGLNAIVKQNGNQFNILIEEGKIQIGFMPTKYTYVSLDTSLLKYIRIISKDTNYIIYTLPSRWFVLKMEGNNAAVQALSDDFTRKIFLLNQSLDSITWSGIPSLPELPSFPAHTKYSLNSGSSESTLIAAINKEGIMDFVVVS